MTQPLLTVARVVTFVIGVFFGVFLWWAFETFRQWRIRLQVFRIQNTSLKNPNYGRSLNTPKAAEPVPAVQIDTPGAILLESVTIRHFKNISELKLDLMRPSTLRGEWTCIAGINGAGKTSVLQAICLVLLGAELVNELGRGRLGRLPQRTSRGTLDAEIEAVVLRDGKRTPLYLPLKRDGRGEAAVDMQTLQSHPDFECMKQIWDDLRQQVFVTYGASRNVSDFKDPRLSNFSRAVQRQMTLFDPLTQLASVDIILEGGEKVRPIMNTLYSLIRTVLASEALQAEAYSGGDKLRFSVHGTTMDVIDLPDGFRSTVAWLGDICAAWHERDKADGKSDPDAITGIVLLDEIGLHLHPSLEKVLVPQLRKALPRVQFIVSTHSPMVLSSFDRDELVILDAASPGGTRQLDRQVFGMTMDDVYSWLMKTSPGSPVMEQMLQERDPEVATFLYQSKDVNADLARKLVDERKEDLRRLQDRQDKS